MPDIDKILRKLIDQIAKEQNYDQHEAKVEAITSGGANYSSELFNITLSAPEKDDLKLFAKVATIGENLRHIMNANQVFVTERLVYTKLAKVYYELQEKHNIADEDMFKFPKFFGVNSNLFEETVVLENLAAQGFKNFDRFTSVDWSQAASIVEVLAKFHALSFAFQKEQPEEFEKHCDLMIDMDLISMSDFFQKMIDKSMVVLKDEHRERVLRCLKSGGDNPYAKYNTHLGKKVLVHGDYRPSNMLYKKRGDEVDTIPVDYQTVHVGCPVSDLVYFVFLATDEQFRAQHYERLIEHYYEQLALALNRLGLIAAEAYSREEFYSNLKELLPYGLYIGLAGLSVVMVEPESAPTMAGADARVDNMAVEPNELCAERLNGIINDFIRWGVL